MTHRETWSRNVDFLFACVGFSVGFGNVWRFPYLCFRNGGGAFLIPYVISVLLCGFPTLLLEVALGQLTRRGIIQAWLIAPIMQGVGYACVVSVIMVNCMYNVILAWVFHYLFSSFTSNLPWTHCNNTWNTDLCFDGKSNQSLMNVSRINHTSPALEYWEQRVLHQSEGITELGTIRWELALTLLLAWVLVYLSICGGIRASGKVLYFTAPAPYVFMIILLIRGVTLPGAEIGLKYYLQPDFSKLADVQVWVDAATQICFSNSLALGTLTALGSYNKPNHNSFRDSIIYSIIDLCTSLLAGLVIFPILGFMSYKLDKPIESFATSGSGLAFVVYPSALAEMYWMPELWSVLFFAMLVLLGLDSQFVGVEGFVTVVTDAWPHFFDAGRWRRPLVLAAICALKYAVGLLMVCDGGIYIFTLFNEFAASKMVMLIASFECITVTYLYGANRFLADLEAMWGFRHSTVLRAVFGALWKFITPLTELGIFVCALVVDGVTLRHGNYEFPVWAVLVGWAMAALAPIMIPIVAIYRRLRPYRPLAPLVLSNSFRLAHHADSAQPHQPDSDPLRNSTRKFSF